LPAKIPDLKGAGGPKEFVREKPQKAKPNFAKTLFGKKKK
jgi:hypothetical protein